MRASSLIPSHLPLDRRSTTGTPPEDGADLSTVRRPARRRAAARCAALLLLVVPWAPARAEGPESAELAQRFARERQQMVEQQIASRGVTCPEVLRAMGQVPRHRFVLPEDVNSAYADTPLPIGHGQTISQPYIVALMSELLNLDRGSRVLEVGTGSGYHAAVLSQIAGEVYTVEIVEPLAEAARRLLAELGYDNVHARQGDGYRGWAEEAPFDGIVLTAAPGEVPPPLLDQLADGGHMVLPLGAGGVQELLVITRHGDRFERQRIAAVRFVPMTGEVQRREAPP